MPPKRKRSRSLVLNSHQNQFYMKDFHNILQEDFDGTVDPKATAYFLGVIQYIATEIIELSANAAREGIPKGKPFTITTADIRKAITADGELSQIFPDKMEMKNSEDSKKRK